MVQRPAIILAAACAFIVSCASRSEEPTALELEPYIGRLVTLEAQLGDQTASMIFDTGAGVTALTPALTPALGCAPFGRLVGHRMSGERVEFQKCGGQPIAFDGFASFSDVYVFDLMALLPDGLPEVGGIVSLASFLKQPFTLDLANGQLIVESDASLSERIKQGKQGNLRLSKGPGGEGEITAFVQVEAETGDLWFLLDSANLDHVIIAPHALDQLGMGFEQAPTDGDVVDLEFEIAGAFDVSASARIRDFLYDGVINEDVMRRFLITFDLENERIWFSYAVETDATTP